MPDLTASDLSDPQPPVPGERERALVATRAHQLGRRRRLLQGGGALALVAAVAVSVAALTAGGTSGPGGTNGVQAASDTDTGTEVSTPVSHITTAPTTVAPAPTNEPTRDTTTDTTTDTTPAAQGSSLLSPQDVAPSEPAAPTTFTLSGTVTGNPADTTVTLHLSGPGGDRTVDVDGAGNFSITGLDAGDYVVIGDWNDSTNSASRSEKFGTVAVATDSSVDFTFSS
ncbi:MAG TPA: hypothetical protein VK549_01245 [Acidimicrobiia bacterium]|nr:hypothetical protein [Acidimicrobiia bacterium]